MAIRRSLKEKKSKIFCSKPSPFFPYLGLVMSHCHYLLLQSTGLSNHPCFSKKYSNNSLIFPLRLGKEVIVSDSPIKVHMRFCIGHKSFLDLLYFMTSTQLERINCFLASFQFMWNQIRIGLIDSFYSVAWHLKVSIFQLMRILISFPSFSSWTHVNLSLPISWI